MGSFGTFLFIYVLGGITFIPLILAIIFIHALLTSPIPPIVTRSEEDKGDGIEHKYDDQDNLRTGTDELAEKFQRAHESDVAAGYFAVCREYVPGGVNGKPPERTTPAGEVIATESPSVYQSVYRSIFDRKQPPTIDPTKGNGKGTRKARNVFFVVLRHGHLMLYDDAEQFEVRYVISLSHHHVSIYGGGDPIPEGELWIKRNAICLSRKGPTLNLQSSQPLTLPFYLFSENLSEKEDFYFAILNNLDKVAGSPYSPPATQTFGAKEMITLVKRLHSSEEQLQTRWFNALVGRLFLALYKTPELEEFIWKKITKKISRVKKPNFITKITLEKLDAGEGAPLITNPRLKDLTVDGDCCVEADVEYSGNFRVEIAATARIELGTRFKPREVDLVLAAVLKKLKGHVLIRIKPPPSNRLWISFETMPLMEMAIEPIVSSRQITYGIILRAIESRIREVMAETLVQPFWDDIPFLDTESQKFRGGIWQGRSKSPVDTMPADNNVEQQTSSADATPESLEAQTSTGDNSGDITMPLNGTPPTASQGSEKSMNIDGSSNLSTSDADKVKKVDNLNAEAKSSSPTSSPELNVETMISEERLPHDTKPQSKTTINTANHITSRPISDSPISVESSSISSNLSSMGDNDSLRNSTPPPTAGIKDEGPSARSRTQSDTSKTPEGFGSESYNRTDSITGKGIHQRRSSRSFTGSSSLSSGQFEARQAMMSIGSAAAAAKKWGWNVLNRPEQQPANTNDHIPDHPIGRGRPLPPPGTPLPSPGRFNFMTNSGPKPKRKPLPPPLLPERSQQPDSHRPVPKPPLPKRRSIPTPDNEQLQNEDLLVIKAPPSSEPNSPLHDHEEDAEENVASSDPTAEILTEDRVMMQHGEDLPSLNTDRLRTKSGSSIQSDESARKE